MNPLRQICAAMWQLQEQTQYLCFEESQAASQRNPEAASRARANRAVLATDLALTREALTRFPAANDSE